MCLLALYFRVADDAPIIVGANREESYARPGEPAQILDGPCRIVAGRDPEAGGTWLGVNEHGLLVAVTNRGKSSEPEKPRSRGLLARDLLGLPSAAVAVGAATQELGEHRYRGCNVLCVDKERAVVIHAADWLRVRMLPPGIHAVANDDVNDETDPRVHYALSKMTQQAFRHADHCVHLLKQICAQREDPAICLRGDDRGTVSSSLIVLRSRLANSTYLHAQGPPDCTPYQDLSSLLD